MVMGPDPQVYRIGSLTLDLAQGRLLSGAGMGRGLDSGLESGGHEMRPKTYLLLTVLARNAGRVMSKDELLTAVWPDVIVTEDSLSQCVHDLRRALGVEAHLLRTLPRRGYMLEQSGMQVPSGFEQQEDSAVAVPPGSLAVLPFTMPPDAGSKERLLFDGLTHDIITRLAQLRAFRVTGRGSAFALRHLADAPMRLRPMLKVEHVVTGQVLMPPGGRSGKLRLMIDLIRTSDGALDWSEALELDMATLHLAAAEVANRLVTAIALAVTDAERRRALSLRDQPLRAWEAFHLGLDRVFRFSVGDMAAAQDHFSAALKLDSGFARAHAYASFCKYYFAFSGLAGDRKAGAALALASASDALHADEHNPVSHWAYGRALWLGGDPDGGRRHMMRAVDLCPSFPHAHYMLGFIEAQGGDPMRALVHLERSEELSPYDPFLASIQITRAGALLRLGDMEGAALWAGQAAAHETAYAPLLCNAALILASAGQMEAARTALARQQVLSPDYDAESLFATIYTLPEGTRRQLLEAQASLRR